MQYILVFGAVFLIMLAVILLFFFLINTTAEDVSGQVRKTFLKEMEVFDELYEEKAKKLKKVQGHEAMEQFYVPCDCYCTCKCSSSEETRSEISSFSINTERVSDKEILN